MHGKVSGKKQEENDLEVNLGEVILHVSRCKYLGSVLQNDGKINEDVTHRIQAR